MNLIQIILFITNGLWDLVVLTFEWAILLLSKEPFVKLDS